MNSHEHALEFTTIRAQLAELALSDWAKDQCLRLSPLLSEREAAAALEQTTQARGLLDRLGAPPLVSMQGLRELTEIAAKGGMLLPEQLERLVSFAVACDRMKRYLQRAEQAGREGGVAGFGSAILELEELRAAIERAIRGGSVVDDASPALRDLRRKQENLTASMRARLELLLRGHRDWFADSYVANRNGRQTLPVKRAFRNKVDGAVIDTSQTGETVFIEPASVRRLGEQLAQLEVEEENEVRRILYELTVLVDSQADALRLNFEAMETLDLLFAKAKLSQSMDASAVPVRADGPLCLHAARHPLLDRRTAVPLDIVFPTEVRGVVITGPNTGGKTVALKTLGLLTLMAQSGLHIPAGEGSALRMCNAVYADIGDGQSISENLSTFSAHLTNIIGILQAATSESLVLLDELGSGTDPAEGMGLAVAVLEELAARGCLLLATTHYPEIKAYAARHPALTNARMGFDRETLRPLYRLEMGLAGESCALYIARRLGFPPALLRRAEQAVAEGAAEPAQRPGPDPMEVPEPAAGPPPASVPRAPAIRREKPEKPREDNRAARFQRGDSVLVYPQKEIGIVCRTADEHGELGVLVKGRERSVMHKRLKLLAPASELYPPDYDFSVVFDTVANRKARHRMERKHDPDAVIVHNEGSEGV